jgi:hypothetical protein
MSCGHEQHTETGNALRRRNIVTPEYDILRTHTHG